MCSPLLPALYRPDEVSFLVQAESDSHVHLPPTAGANIFALLKVNWSLLLNVTNEQLFKSLL